MGCDYYYGLHFSEINDSVGCLCTFPFNDGDHLTTDRVRSLAYLGAAIVLAQRGELQSNIIPDCLPVWIKEGVDKQIIMSTTPY
jgi:hypothetical protein